MNPKSHTNRNLALAIASVLVSAAIITAPSTTPFPGVTSTVVMTVESKDGTRSQFIGYVTGADVPQIVLNHKDAKRFQTAKELLRATSTFLGKIKQDDIILLTSSTSNLSAMFRDMRTFGIKVSMASCISCTVNVPEVVGEYAHGATFSQFGREQGIDVAGIEQNPILLVTAQIDVYKCLRSQTTEEQTTARSTSRSA